MTDASGTTQWAYDAMGRVLREHRAINSVTKDTTYTYNLDGSLGTLTYPSGRLVTYTPSAVGRPLSAADTTHSVTYVNSAHYAPQGALSSALFGQSGAISYSVSFNNRLLPSMIYAHTASDKLKLEFGYFSNGNVQTITNDLNSARTLSFTYDNLNRLATAQTVATSGQYCWGQSVPTDGTGYDRYGNLLKINSSQCTSPTLNLSANTYNQITNSGFSYDNAGDMTADGVTSYVWNGAGLLKTVGSTTYTYDGDGKRVMNSAGTYYWTTPAGDQLSDTPGSGAGNEYIFFAGQRIAWVDSAGTVRYYWGDHLGTTRIVTDASGNVCYDADYYPFQGERPPYVNTCTPAYRMAGMKFDQESGNYYTLNRYYPPNLGRWLSPDPLAGDITNPQSLNRYAYVLNNPTTFIDPLGLQDKSNIKLQAEPTASGCTLNGIYTSCSVVYSLVGAGAAVACTSIDCGGLRPTQGPGGTTTISTTQTYTFNIPGGCVTVTDANGNPSTECTGPSSITLTVTTRQTVSDVQISQDAAYILGTSARMAGPTVTAAAAATAWPVAVAGVYEGGAALTWWAMTHPDEWAWMMRFATAALNGGPPNTWPAVLGRGARAGWNWLWNHW
jgi:RHS repeat-associated protein